MDHPLEHEGITYRFTLLTLGQEEEWQDWVRESKMSEAMGSSEGWPMDLRAKFLAEVSKTTPRDQCGFMGDIGKSVLASEAGVLKVLELGLRKNHPNPPVPFEAVKKLFQAKSVDCARIMLNILPITEDARKAMMGEFEKKVIGQPGGQA